MSLVYTSCWPVCRILHDAIMREKDGRLLITSQQMIVSLQPMIVLEFAKVEVTLSSSCILLSAGNAYNLFAFPSECNFSGLRFSLDLANLIKENSERILEGSPFCKYVRCYLILLFSVFFR